MWSKFLRYFHTLRHLRVKQVVYQLKCRLLRSPIPASGMEVRGENLRLEPGVKSDISWLGNSGFLFLNLDKDFKGKIDWNYSNYGKLWIYNLNYFDFLNQEDLSQEAGLGLIRDYLENDSILKDGLEPYPISLRGINWIKFLSNHSIQDEKIDEVLFRHYRVLLNKLEYHLLANHLLENAFSLVFGAWYFRDENLRKQGVSLLKKELEEQYLEDGAHYELSPMYHQILLLRALDTFNLLKNNPWKDGGLVEVFEQKLPLMLGWLESITFSDGSIPHVNDCTQGIAPTSEQLFAYAKQLDLTWSKAKINDSGYRNWGWGGFEAMMDVGQIAPSYQPGHSHADNLNFVLYYQERPVIVDTGISTYKKNERRYLERSTQSHNTVTISDKNSSDVWGGFRVGKRARSYIQKDEENLLVATHNGYRSKGVIVQRSFERKGASFVIKDTLHGNTELIATGRLHFDNSLEVNLDGNRIILSNGLSCEFTNTSKLWLETYEQAIGFNKLVKAQRLCYNFKDKAEVYISNASI